MLDIVSSVRSDFEAERWRFFCGRVYQRSAIGVGRKERKVRKAIWLGVEDVHEEHHVGLHPSLVGSIQESFQSMPVALSSQIHHPPYCSPSLPGASCWEVSGRHHRRSCGERAKLMSWGCVMRVGLLKAWGNGCCSCWTTWPWYWVLQRAAAAPQISTTLVAIGVVSPCGAVLRGARATPTEEVLVHRRLVADSQVFTI